MGSSPIRVATFLNNFLHADLAHLVERRLAKAKVAGSSPVIRSKKKKSRKRLFLFLCFSFLSKSSIRNFSGEEIRGKREAKIGVLRCKKAV